MWVWAKEKERWIWFWTCPLVFRQMYLKGIINMDLGLWREAVVVETELGIFGSQIHTLIARSPSSSPHLGLIPCILFSILVPDLWAPFPFLRGAQFVMRKNGSNVASSYKNLKNRRSYSANDKLSLKLLFFFSFLRNDSLLVWLMDGRSLENKKPFWDL